jgi:hypothetical protein
VAEPRLISGYLAALAAELPAQVVEELADGLDETFRHHLGRGLGADNAARAAVAEFGDYQLIVAAFTRASRARAAARNLMLTGPVAGACWATALITGRAWDWPIPFVVRALFGLALVIVIGLLAAAVSGRRYRPVRRAAAVGCAGTLAVDAALVGTILAVGPALIWPLALAVAVSTTRISFGTWNLRQVLAN